MPSSSPASGSDPRARSFGTVAETYERGRPGWPVEVLDVVPVQAGSDVLDLAAGTGKLTRLLATRHRVIAVEPDDAMRGLITGAEAVAGAAESIPLTDASVDAVFVGEAFHWFDGGLAVPEIARVLRPHGVLALMFGLWEDFQPGLPVPVLDFLARVEERFGPAGGPKVASGEWRRPFPGPFEELREVELVHREPYDRDRVVALFASMSNVARQPPETRAEFGEELGQLVPDEPRTLTVRVRLHWTRRR